MATGSRLRIIGGPNGSGKSTLLDYLARLASEEHFPLGFVQNPDSIQGEIVASKRLFLGTWGVRTTEDSFAAFVRAHPLFSQVSTTLPQVRDDAMTFPQVDNLGYLIPILCDFFRQQWIAGGENFTFETVMSGSDKLDVLKLAKRRQYRTYLYYICTDDVAINEARILNRVQRGGHPVPQEKVATRYERSLEQLADAIKMVSRAFIFDNSGMEHRLIAEFEAGHVLRLYQDPQPRWFSDAVLKKLKNRRKPTQRP